MYILRIRQPCNTQLQGIHTCNNDNDATSFPWRVDSVGIPDKIDVWRNAVGMDAISPRVPPRPVNPLLPSHHLTTTTNADDANGIPTHGASAINASALNTSHSQKCIACACDECYGGAMTACKIPNAVSGMSGLWTRPRSRNRVIPLQSTRLHDHSSLFFFP